MSKDKTVQITITITQEDVDNLTEYARALGVARSSLIRNIIRASYNKDVPSILDTYFKSSSA